MNETFKEPLNWDLALPTVAGETEVRVLYFLGEKPVQGLEADWLNVAISVNGNEMAEGVFVARLDTIVWYALSVTEEAVPSDWSTVELRALAASDTSAFALASRAVQLLRWRDNHRFCGACGAATEASMTEHARTCGPCRQTYYPKILPCVIVLIKRGDHMLLARHNRHVQSDQFSLIAGFVEAGETLEQAVHREVLEEVGIRVANLAYQGSQTWPFPGQLMLGFTADYDGGSICIQDDELVEAGWFSLDQLPKVPNKLSIAGWMIRQHVRECGGDEDHLVQGW